MIFFDSTHGTFVPSVRENEAKKYHFFTIMVCYEDHGFPMAFFLMSNMDQHTHFRCLQAFKDRNPEFEPQVRIL